MRIDHYDLQGEVQHQYQQLQTRKVRNLGPVAPVVPGNTTAAPKGAMIRAVCQLTFNQPSIPIAKAAPSPAQNGPYHFFITFLSWFV